jgi:two-component system phosphate regulon sensor histidine kinase PhoR
VETGLRGGDVFVEVQDRGIGIPVEYHNKIFEKFYRVSGGLVHTAKGSGLGLALVRHIVQAHSGTVEVESSLGNGSIFRIVLPRKKS